MYIFIDESGTTDETSKQKFLVISFVISENKAFVDRLIFKIRRQCELKCKAIKRRELSYHDLTPFQREIAVKPMTLMSIGMYQNPKEGVHAFGAILACANVLCFHTSVSDHRVPNHTFCNTRW